MTKRVVQTKTEAGLLWQSTIPLLNLSLTLILSEIIISICLQRATGWTSGILGFDSRQGLEIIFTTASRMALGPTQPPIQWLIETLFLGVKRPGRESDHSPTSSAEVKNALIISPLPQYVFTAWCWVKAQGWLYLFTTSNELRLWLLRQTLIGWNTIGTLEKNLLLSVSFRDTSRIRL
jgi:hypothetical protein